MPTRAEILYDAMAMDRTDALRLTGIIRGRYIDAYVEAIQQMMNDFGLQETARPRPSPREAVTIGEMAVEDAKGIVETYNNDLRRKIDILLRDNPDAPLDAYRAYLNDWYEERRAWKDEQISRASASGGAEYGRGQFIEKNRLTTSLVTWFAIPPIVFNSHQTCIQRVQRGAVSWEEAQDWLPPHPFCRHIRRVVGQPTISGEIWRG
ncbi:MAG TPA: hypothetical protein VFY83_08325 [Anaerolineales bacterium]|nr:hypothetical protein [Anaerolineales bacterium]